MQNLKQTLSFRMIAIFTSLIIVVSAIGILCNISVSADDVNVWDGSLNYDFEGNGTENDPYRITSAAELYGFAKKYCGEESFVSEGKYFILTDDIYLNNVYDSKWADKSPREWAFLNTWTVNANAQGFRGNFDGKGHTVYGMYYENPNDWAAIMGLFPMVSGNAIISNVNVRHSYVKASTYKGSLGGIVGFVNKNKNGTSSNVKISKCVVDNTVDFSGLTNCFAGGIVGPVRESYITIEYCGSSAKFNDNYSPAGSGGGILANGASYDIKGISIKNTYTVVGFTTGLPGKDKLDPGSISDDTFYSAIGWWKTNVGVNQSVVSESNMRGSKAQENMTELDWNIWEAHSKDYPIIKGSTAGKRDVDNSSGKAGEVWSGKIADSYYAGTGTKSDPYIIMTAEQLYKMVKEHCVADDPEPGAYYELGADIYLNDVSEKEWYNGTALNRWLDVSFQSQGQGFKGRLNGKNHTVYGLYYNKTRKMGGLIPVMAGSSSVKNLHIRKAYLSGRSNGSMCYLGGIAGYVQAGAAASISKCSVRDIVTGAANGIGGLVGAVSAASFKITSCCFIGSFSGSATNEGGYLGDNWGSVTVNDSYTAGCISFYRSAAVSDGVRYATVSQSLSPHAATRGISCTVVSEESMLGENAKNSMPLLDWETAWCVADNDYPQLLISDDEDSDGIVGAVWSGKCAENYAGGTGTQDDPYQIATGEQLYKMVSEHVINGDTPAWYVITEDIKLNDTTEKNWHEAANLKQWFSAAGINNAFAGYLDGQGHIVSGMYIKSDGANVKGSLIPIIDKGASIKNLGVTDSYIDLSLTNSEVYGSGLVAYVKYWIENTEMVEKNYPVIDNCFVDSSVSVKARTASGIVGGLPSPLTIRNSYSVAKLTYGYRGAAIIGDAWCKGEIIENCYGCTDNFDKFADGKSEVTVSGMTVKGGYIFGAAEGDVLFVGINDMLGDAAKNGMPDFDYENVWMTVENSTPILKIFYPRIKTATNADNRYSTITFVTGVDGLSVEPVTAKVGSKFTAPTPSRAGYSLEGWYVYPEYQCRYTDDFFPYVNITLYANWEQDAVIQNFEAYTNTEYDLGEDYEYYKPGVADYTAEKVHGGNKCIHRIGNTSGNSEFLLNYEDELTVGGEYEISFWVYKDSQNTSGNISLVYKTWPDIAESDNGTEKMISFSELKSGEWTECTYSFVAKSKWLSFITSGNTSLYFDDVMIFRTSDKINYIPEKITPVNVKPEKRPLPQQTVSKNEEITDTESKEDISQENGENSKQDSKPKKVTAEKTEEKEFNYLWIAVPVASAVIIIGSVLLLLYFKKRKG